MNNESVLLRITVYSDQKIGNITLYEQIVLKAKELNIKGVTAVKGMMGFIGNDEIRRPKLSRLSESLPVIIEIADTEENINKLLPFLDKSIQRGLVALMPVSSFKK